jgi:hypothetical protein
VKALDLLNSFREGLSQASREVEAAVAMQHYDIASVSENLILGLLRELFGFAQLRNLNAEERRNFPGIDLVDDGARVAVQVTASASIDKIKATIETCIAHKLEQRFDRLIVYVLTRRQDSYSQTGLDKLGATFPFDAKKDVLDFRDLAATAAHARPNKLRAAVAVLEEYMRGGVSAGLAVVDLDPPRDPPEKVLLNLVELFIPRQVYVADLVGNKLGDSRRRSQRDRVRQAATELGFRVPSDYEVSAGQLITFHDPEREDDAFHKLIDLGTVTQLGSDEYCRLDQDHERIFKSLLRFCVQQKLYKQRVHWKHEDGLFVFMPTEESEFLREATWLGQKQATRRVFEKKLNKKDPTKVFHCKHFAFAVDFVKGSEGWFVALTPDWYFSYGDDFRRSRFADEQLKWIKRHETNRIVADHFRFLAAWLKDLDQADLFEAGTSQTPSVTFGNLVSFGGHPALDDSAWLPLKGYFAAAESDMAQLFEES